MAVTFDASSTGRGYPPYGYTFTHSLGYGTGHDRIVLLGMCNIGGTAQVVTQCTYHGVPMIEFAYVQRSYYSRIGSSKIFYLRDSNLPATPGGYNVSITVNGPYNGCSTCHSYVGVKQSIPRYSTNSGFRNPSTSQSFSTSITPVSSSGMIYDFAGADTPTGATVLSPLSGQYKREGNKESAALCASADKTYSSGGVKTHQWVPNGNIDAWFQVLAELEEAGLTGSRNNAAIMGAAF